jgi:hypothetical protein
MRSSIRRAISAASLGALAGAACLVAVFVWNPAIAFEMDRNLPRFATGFYPVERNGEGTFVWTGERADVTLAGLDRRVPWVCSIRFRGARAPNVSQPDLEVAVDGIRVGSWPGTNDFRDVVVVAPANAAKAGLTLTLISTTTFVPGEADARPLGVQIDRLSCRPVAGIALPPHRAIGLAAVAAALLGAGFAAAGLTAAGAAGAALVMAVGQAWAIVRWGASFGSYPGSVVYLAFWVACVMALLVRFLEFLRSEPLRNAARCAITLSAGTLYLQLVALLHPSKAVIDALFHAHRFDDVLVGRFYFTQLSTSATPFPYAIGLYLFAAPWAFLTTNHVALLRVVVSSAEIVAGALLYPMVVRAWGNRLVGAVAVALFSLVPASYGIIGNANLTNAFGQAVSVVAVAAVVLSAERLRQVGPFLGVGLLVTLGLICHVSTVVLLTSTLVAVATLFYRFGDQSLRASARSILLITIVALLGSTLLYWGHFGAVYSAQFERMRVSAAATQRAGESGSGPNGAARSEDSAAPALGRGTLPLSARVKQTLSQTVSSLGWPILLLALVGIWRLTLEGARDRLGLAISGWGVVCLAFVAFSALAPGSRTYQQDAFEFISRVEHATMPAAVLLAARGAVWAWCAGRTLRVASGALLLWAVVTGVLAWAQWLS